MRAVPVSFTDALGRLGTAPGDVDALVALWESGAPTPELFAAIAALRSPAGALDEARAGFVRFGRQDPSAWAPLVPAIAYAHAKFWELDDAGDDLVRTAELVSVLAEAATAASSHPSGADRRGSTPTEADAFELVGRHHARCGRLLADAEASVGRNQSVLRRSVEEK